MLTKNYRFFLWALVALVPFIFMAGSFVTDHWSWGLMDDNSFLNQPGSWWERFVTNWNATLSWGTFRTTYAAYTATFYPLFNDDPKLFYFFRMVFSMLTLLIWGWNARILSRSKTALYLVPVVSLTFYFYYDSFSYLSVQEPMGLFFTGLMTFCFLTGGLNPVFEQKPLKWSVLFAGFVCLVLGVLSKEVFISTPLALGLVLTALSVYKKRKDLFFFSASIILLVVSFAVYLKCFYQHGYTAGYSLSDMANIRMNLKAWLRYSFIFHIPWVVFLTGALISRWRNVRERFFDSRQIWGAIIAFLMYVLFLGLLLPWRQVTDFYVIPLGVFFGFIISILLSGFLEECPIWIFRSAVVGSLIFVVLVCGQSFGKMRTYRNDTALLLDWLKYNQQFQRDIRQGYQLATNAMEAGDTIPIFFKNQTGLDMPPFRYMTRVRDIVYSQDVAYYLYNPLLGDQDLRRINQMWSVVFSSRSWTLYRRLVWARK